MKLDLDKNQKRQSEKEMDNAEKFSFFFTQTSVVYRRVPLTRRSWLADNTPWDVISNLLDVPQSFAPRNQTSSTLPTKKNQPYYLNYKVVKLFFQPHNYVGIHGSSTYVLLQANYSDRCPHLFGALKIKGDR